MFTNYSKHCETQQHGHILSVGPIIGNEFDHLVEVAFAIFFPVLHFFFLFAIRSNLCERNSEHM